MQSTNAGWTSIDEYIAAFPAETQQLLETVRATIRAAAPDATEKISYQMPTFALHGNLVHFAAWKNHIGFYPAPTGLAAFEQDLAPYKTAKGSVQFPLDQPLPLDVIDRIVRWRVAENRANAEKKRKK